MKLFNDYNVVVLKEIASFVDNFVIDPSNKEAALAVGETDVYPVATELDNSDLITLQTVNKHSNNNY